MAQIVGITNPETGELTGSLYGALDHALGDAGEKVSTWQPFFKRRFFPHPF